MQHAIDAVRASRFRHVRAAVLATGLIATGTGGALAAEISKKEETSGGTVGVASYYGREHNGGPTASGERFDMRAMTAAHRTAPMGSKLRVTNLRNGRSVVVRINDRGPFVRGRVIDVSRGAAEALGFVGQGVAKVRIQVASREE